MKWKRCYNLPKSECYRVSATRVLYECYEQNLSQINVNYLLL